MISLYTTYEEWNEFSQEEKMEYVGVIVQAINKKDRTEVNPDEILNMIEERFKWGQYIERSLCDLFSDCISLKQRIGDKD